MKAYRGTMISGIIFLLYSVFMLITSMSIENTGITSLGAGFIPKLVFGLMTILSCVLLIMTYFTKDIVDTEETSEKKTIDFKTVGATMILFIAYVLSIVALGFVVSSIIYMFLQMIILSNNINKKNIIKYLVISVSSPFIINYIFVEFFSLLLPMGILG